MSQKMDRRREIAAQRAARSARFQKSPAKMRAEAQEYAAAQRAQAVKPAEKNANVLERTAATVFDVAVANPTDGLMEWIEGASIDLPLGIVGVVGGWINDDFGNTVRNVVAHDTWGALMGNRMQEWSAASYTNGNKAGEIVEEVANGLGGMLPTVLAGIFTGGASVGVQTAVTMGATALGAAGKATQGAYQDGASREAGLGYGLVSGGIEAGTEKLLGGAGTLGKGLVKTGGKVAAQGGKRVLKSMAEEAGEEMLSELADPIAKTIYKGSDALGEYGTSDYWLGLAEAGAVGGLTAGVYGGTLGHAVTKMRGANADIDASLESIEELGEQQAYLFVKDKLDAKKYSTINENVKSNFNNVEKVLKKASPETRARLMDTYKLHDAFDDSGNMRSEFAAELDKKIAVGQIPTDGLQTPGSEFSPYVSPNLAANREELESDLALINEDLGKEAQNDGGQQSTVTIFNGELSKEARREYRDLKRAANNLNSVSGDNFNIAIVNAGADFNGVTVKGKNIYISAELLENGGWAPTLIHELTHFTEGSPEYNKFARFLLSSNPEAAARKASELTAEGNAYGFTRENVERDFGVEGDITSGRRALQYSKNENFNEEIDEWNKDGKPEDGYFVLGTTGDVLQGLGAIESDIYMLTDKINAILHDHPEITLDEIKRIPDILEDPVLILKSHNVGRKGKANTRLVIFGSVKAKNGQPMLSVLDLRPNEKNLIIEDMQKLTSAYTKTQNPVEFIGNSDIVYADKKRTTPLLRTIGFQMPIELNESGSIGSISYKRQFVNILGKKFSEIVNVNNGKDSTDSNTNPENNSDNVPGADFASELIASIAEDSVGTDGAFIDRLVRGNETLAAKVINKIHDAVAALESRKSPEARAEYKRLKNAEKLFMRAVESTGKRYVDGKIVADDEEPKKIQFSRMNDKSLESNVNDILQMSNEEAKSNATEGNFVSVMKNTPATILNHVKGAEDLEVIIRFDALYLATRKKGCLEGHYHNLGKDIVSNLPRLIANHDAIIRLGNGRINVLADLSSMGKQNGIISVELNTVKDINSKHDKYNLVVSAFSAKDNYLKNLIQNHAIGLEYQKEDLSQVNPQLYEWLASINDKSSTNSIPENSENVNTKLQYSKKSSVQSVKNFANENREKVYSKKEIRAMLKNVSRDLLSFEDGDFGLVGQNQTKVVEKFFNAFNAAKDDGRRYAVCMELADYMLKHASMLNAELPPYTLELTERLNVLRRYIHKLDLDGIRGEIKHRYGKDNSPYLLWHKSGGVSPDAIVSELAEQGIIIEAENEADVFFEIDDIYKKYRQTLNEDMNVYLDNTLRFVTDDERRQKQEEIAKELLISFDRYGSSSKLARFTNEYERRINDLKDYIHEIKDEAAIKNKAVYVANQIKQFKKGEFVKASDYRDDRFDGSIGKLANLTYRGNLKRGEVIRETLGTLRSWYADHSNKFFHGDEGGYRDDISNMMYEISQGEGELSYAELQGLVKVLDYFKKMIETQDKIYKNGKWIEARPVAKDFDKRIKESRQIKSGFLHKLITGKYQQQFGDNASVMRAADLYDPDGFFTTTFTEFRKAAEAAELMKLELRAELEEFFHDKKNKKYIKRLTEEKVELYGEEITVGEAISVYMTHNREQAWAALCKSGFVVKDKKGKTHTFRGLVDEKTAKKLVDNEQMKVYINESKAKIRELLNDTDMEYISIIERAFAKCSSIKEKIDVERLGYSNVLKNKYYYPIRRFDIAKKVDDTDYYFEVESASHMSFNENTVKSSNRLSIEATDTVFNRHVNGIALYANFAIINENLNRVLNISTADTQFVKSSLAMTIKEDKKAQEAWNFLQKIKDDISGLKVNDDKLFSDVMGFLRSGYAKAALAANPKVFATQLSSFVAAGSMLDYNSIVRGISMRVDKTEVDKYCKTALLRNAENTVVKAQTITDKTGKFSDTLMAPIGMIDRSVVVKLFGACQAQVEKDRGLKLGTEENKKAAGELLSEVIFETQQNSLVTERSAAMRSQQEVMKSLVMFSADAMKLTGRFVDAVGEWHATVARIKYLESDRGKAENAAAIKTLESRKAELEAEIEKLKEGVEEDNSGRNISSLEQELKSVDTEIVQRKNADKLLDKQLNNARKKLARSASAIVSSSVFMSVIALAFRYLYGRLDDKEPKEIALDVGVDLFGNMIGGLPFARDVYSLLLEGYEIDISSVSMFSDFLTSTKSCWTLLVDAITGKEITSQKAYYTAKKVVTDACHLFGVPVRNMYNATYGTIKLFHPSAAYTMDSWFYDKNYRSDLKEALEKDDNKMISTITGLMLKDGNTDYDAGAGKAITGLVKQGYSVLPRSVGDTVTYNGETVSLTANQRRTIQKTYHEADEEINKLSRISMFKSVSSDIQAKAINFIYEMYWQKALAATFGSTGKTKNELFAVGIDPYVLAIIVATARSMESDKDAKGKAISGSRLKKIEAYLESQQLSAAQKHMLLGYLGYKNTKGEDKVKAYISSLTLTANEKAALMEYSGYTVA